MKPDLVRQQAHQAIRRRLGYRFVHIELLQQASTHRSFNAKNDECFELVGDVILNYSTAKILFDALPKLTKDELPRLRANLVNEYVLAEIVLEMNTDDGLYLGAGELGSDGLRRPSILVNAIEAMSAAVSLDAGFTVAEEVVCYLLVERVKRVDFRNQGKDNRTVLREVLQMHHLPLPKYRIEKQVGGIKDNRFVVLRNLGELGFTCRVQGTNRKTAKREAAAEVLIWLERQLPLEKNKK